MNLGLLNILMAQQVDKPDHSKIADNAVSQAKDIGEKKFKDHLDAPDKPAAAKNDNQPNVPAAQNLTYDNNKAVAKSKDVNTAQSNTEPAAANNVIQQPPQITAKTTEKILQDTQDELTQAFTALQDKGANGNNNVLSTLLSLQENTSTDTTTTDISTAAQNTTVQTVATVLPEAVQGVAGVVQQAITDIATSLSGAKKDILAAVSDDSTDQKDTGTDANAVVTTPVAVAQNAPTITAVAATIINIAKTNAQTPEVLATDAKSAQVDSLLKTGKETGNSEDGTKVKAANTETKTDVTTVLDKGNKDAKLATTTTNQQNTNTANTNLANDQLNQNIISADNASAKAAAPTAKPAEDSAPKPALDTLLQAGLSNDINVSPDQNFVKFQKYLDAVGATQNNISNDQLTKAQDIIAQIKFGASSLAGKSDNTISIQLHPKELGSIDVRMEINAEGKTKVSIMAEKTDTLNLLQKEAPSLKDMLQDALKTDSSQMNFSFHDRNDNQWKQMIHDAFGRSGTRFSDDSMDAISPAIYQQRFTATDGLDIRV
jgi:flagellar hook-length control protein FliK